MRKRHGEDVVASKEDSSLRKETLKTSAEMCRYSRVEKARERETSGDLCKISGVNPPQHASSPCKKVHTPRDHHRFEL